MDQVGLVFLLTEHEVKRVCFQWSRAHYPRVGDLVLCVAQEAATSHCVPLTQFPDHRLKGYPQDRFQVYGKLACQAGFTLQPSDFEALKRGETIGEEPGPSLEERVAALEAQVAQLVEERKGAEE